MNVLVACEFSGIVRDSFIKKGHNAWSCDIIESDNPTYHFKEDILNLLDFNWDLLIAHPPCTYLCNSGVRWLSEKPGRKKLMRDSAIFFKSLLEADINKICIENPIPHKYALKIIGKKYDQIIQPYQFGHLETKATCLWLKNLSPLIESNNVYNEMLKLPKNKTHKIHYLSPGIDRGKLRSITYKGIANAMATQWGS